MSIFSDALDWAAGGIDEILGYANSYTAAGPMLPGSTGPVTSFLSGAYDAVSWLQDSGVGKGVATYLAKDEKQGGGAFQAPQVAAPKARPSAGSANFSAGRTQGMQNVGISDPRVQNAWSRVRNSRNPAISSTIGTITPTIRRSGPTASLASATISRRKKV